MSKCATKEEVKVRGVFEKPPGSGTWWIHYHVNGTRHREKVGRKSDAIDLYRVRKADALAGRKLPNLRKTVALTLGDLIDDVLEYVTDHKDQRNYISKAEIVRAALGSTPADELKSHKNSGGGLRRTPGRPPHTTGTGRSSRYPIASGTSMKKPISTRPRRLGHGQRGKGASVTTAMTSTTGCSR
jgi:hypothetical protein